MVFTPQGSVDFSKIFNNNHFHIVPFSICYALSQELFIHQKFLVEKKFIKNFMTVFVGANSQSGLVF
jgi:hypothetical protein